MLPIPPLAPARTLAGTALAAAASLLAVAPPAGATALFNAVEVDQSKFVIVAAPIGDGSRAQLNIYEQRSAARPCYAVQGAAPGVVNPLLATFDFTGICNRFIDTNGYSLRVGGTDLATVYRLSVLRSGNDTILLAAPSKPGVGPEMVVARTGGSGSGFLQLVPEPGWRLMRRHFGNRALGHVYIYREDWPTGTATATATPAPTVSPASADSTDSPATSVSPAPAATPVPGASPPARQAPAARRPAPAASPAQAPARGPAPTAAPAAALPPPPLPPAPAGTTRPGRPTAL